MCGWRAAPRRKTGEGGFLLTELAVSLPAFALLLTFLAFALAWGWRTYQQEIADAELRQELQTAAARVAETALHSDRIRESYPGMYEMHQRVRLNDRSSGEALERYWLANGRLVHNFASFPMTGSFAGAGVHVSSFSIAPNAERPRLYDIKITGTSTATGRSYTVETSIYLREDMGGI